MVASVSKSNLGTVLLLQPSLYLVPQKRSLTLLYFLVRVG